MADASGAEPRELSGLRKRKLRKEEGGKAKDRKRVGGRKNGGRIREKRTEKGRKRRGFLFHQSDHC